jgi:2-(1,2-epoxy-1,2-dihydrophenyl)acetyl-CoA isomerase
MNDESILLDISEGVATLTLNRPEARNALSPAMRIALVERVHEVAANREVRCVVLRGAGESFMAGGDVKGFARELQGDKEILRRDLLRRINMVAPAIMGLREMKKPVLASVHGAAAGAGLSLMMACDLAIAADDTVFTLAYARIGISMDYGASYFLPRLVGSKRAAELAFLGDRFSAAEALEMGLINRVCPRGELADETARLAARLARAPTAAIARMKALLNRSIPGSLAEQLRAEAIAFSDSAMTDDFAEGVAAFVEKRPADFKGQ